MGDALREAKVELLKSRHRGVRHPSVTRDTARCDIDFIDFESSIYCPESEIRNISMRCHPERTGSLKHRAPLEVKNKYGGTVLGQAVWSVTNAPSRKPYVPIIEFLFESGAKVEPEFENALAKLMRRQTKSAKEH